MVRRTHATRPGGRTGGRERRETIALTPPPRAPPLFARRARSHPPPHRAYARYTQNLNHRVHHPLTCVFPPFLTRLPQPHPSKNAEPVPRQQLHNSVAAKGQKAGATTKKGGAGGKGTWGKAGDEYDNPSAAMDKGDPNYDPEDAPGKVLEAYD